jgi:hypothetical protein
MSVESGYIGLGLDQVAAEAEKRLAKIARQAEVDSIMAARAGEIQSGIAAARAARNAETTLTNAKKK